MTATGITGSQWFAPLPRSRTHKECGKNRVAGLSHSATVLECLATGEPGAVWRFMMDIMGLFPKLFWTPQTPLVPSMFKKDKLVWGVGCVLSGMSFSQNGLLAGWFFLGPRHSVFFVPWFFSFRKCSCAWWWLWWSGDALAGSRKSSKIRSPVQLKHHKS